MIDDSLKISNIHFILKEYKIYLQVLKNYATNTVNIYISCVDEFVYFLQDSDYYHFSQIDKNTFYKYISFVKNRAKTKKLISNRTVNFKIAAINNFSEFLCKKYYSCELRKVKQLKYISEIPNIIDEQDMLILLKTKNPIFDRKASWVSCRDFALTVLIYSSGARISEILNTTSIDMDDKWIRLEGTKNKTTRYVPVNIHVHIAINNYKEQCPLCLFKCLWICKRGKKLTIHAASAAIKRMFGYSPHYFRHAFATHLILNGCDLRTVQEFLGHSSLVTTSIYTHIKPKHLKKTIEKCHPLSPNLESS
ncbi:tyrosine-type recombinase/integrase [Sulfurimonas sp.]|uniref:tyrosine-type recombinase/integrase n=1 Tax=Sulfurimonas sp. TaxID=2022749 RepID=UPI0025FA430D|nr:tyrosine-type recombinase/integrase [Sulfurimonas sp.]